MSAPAPTFRKDHIPELDGLRGIAVLMVLWVHLVPGALGETVAMLRPWILPGNFGVDLFFVLSGFLITRILLVDRGEGVPLRYFVARRFLRIFPIYYLAIVILWGQMSWPEIVGCATYTSNFVFMGLDEHGPMGHSWSLAIEEHFYLLWPPIVAFTSVRTSRRVILLGVFPMALLSLVLAYTVAPWDTHGSAVKEFIFRSSTVRFASLGVGALLAYSEIRVRGSKALGLAIIVIGAGLSVFLSLPGLGKTGLLETVRQIPATKGDLHSIAIGLSVISFPCLSLALVAAAVVWTGSWAPHAVLLRLAPLRWVGRISYGLYIYHIPIFESAGVWGVNPFEPSGPRVFVVIALSFGVAALSYRFIEQPLLRYGRRFRYSPAQASKEAV